MTASLRRRARLSIVMGGLVIAVVLVIALWLIPRPSSVIPIPSPPRDLLDAARERRSRGQIEQARAYVDGVIDADPIARAQLAGDLAREAGDLRAALADYMRAFDASGAAAEPILARSLAETAIVLEAWPTARRALDQLIDTEPEDGAVWARLERGLLLAAIDPATARADLSAVSRDESTRGLAIDLLTAIDAQPFDAMRVGGALAAHDRWAYAELAYQTAYDTTGDAAALASIGYARVRSGKDGAEEIAQAVASAPNNARVRTLQALYLRALGDTAGSLQAWIAAAALDPENPAVIAELAYAYQVMSNWESAARLFEMAAEMGRDDPRFAELLDDFRAARDEAAPIVDLMLPEETPPDE